MSAISKLLVSKQPALPFKANIPYEQYTTARLQHEHSVTRGQVSRMVIRKHDTLFVPDASDSERMIRAFHEYIDICGDENLKLNNSMRYKKAREILGGDLRAAWDDHIAQYAVALRTNADFPAHIREFLQGYLPSNSFLHQGEYLLQAKKPFGMNCYETASRLRLINKLSIYLPGSNGNKLYTDDLALKNAFFRLMLDQWQLRFEETGRQLDDATYTMQNLISFMEQQRIYYNANINSNRLRNNGRSNSGNSNNRRNNGYSPYPRQQSNNYRSPTYGGTPRYNARTGNRPSNPGRATAPQRGQASQQNRNFAGPQQFQTPRNNNSRGQGNMPASNFRSPQAGGRGSPNSAQRQRRLFAYHGQQRGYNNQQNNGVYYQDPNYQDDNANGQNDNSSGYQNQDTYLTQEEEYVEENYDNNYDQSDGFYQQEDYDQPQDQQEYGDDNFFAQDAYDSNEYVQDDYQHGQYY